ncbi:hypothetical protein LAV84_18350 [Rhizobium sp. VS19-DR104.2]|uniref:hypothetical protein n=1 Tax=unclassified Rhizobium TaxID=2613769 RepID=UPI001CC648A2|nr:MULTISPECIES: hypothetical protein [unclassified Rhizobium]MBZ5761571.1 hypothetical protein [Rhizobium sp. VS19-DR96]MBZ5767519.1 hypothetical protein [Rhizobium sp. VS19-DR129.2]MBZ5775032.1 hypothetical protein [Rhizobium sp. VS19-DRK62.2]MBZ5786002.1 hypothetical protein [Rhizobium sp. VS19-DR121]MBZ5803429.1 hypothetical protein [Rhizobium sp. VS19-DR181]
MRMFSYAYGRIYTVLDVLASLVAALVAFSLAILRTGYATCWMSLQVLKVEAFKVISILSPTYQESYDTHGFSFDGRMRC